MTTGELIAWQENLNPAPHHSAPFSERAEHSKRSGQFRDLLHAGAKLEAIMTLCDPEWDVVVLWHRYERNALAGVGPNAHAGFNLGQGEHEHLDRNSAMAGALAKAVGEALGKSRG